MNKKSKTETLEFQATVKTITNAKTAQNLHLEVFCENPTSVKRQLYRNLSKRRTIYIKLLGLSWPVLILITFLVSMAVIYNIHRALILNSRCFPTYCCQLWTAFSKVSHYGYKFYSTKYNVMSVQTFIYWSATCHWRKKPLKMLFTVKRKTSRNNENRSLGFNEF